MKDQQIMFGNNNFLSPTLEKELSEVTESNVRQYSDPGEIFQDKGYGEMWAETLEMNNE